MNALSNVVAFHGADCPIAPLPESGEAPFSPANDAAATYAENASIAIAAIEAANPEIADLDDEDREAIAAERTKPIPCATGDFIIARDAIGKVISDLARVVEKRNAIPILANVLLQASGGVLVATATDLDCQLSAMVECKPGEFEATLPAHILQDVFRRGADCDEVGFWAVEDGDRVKVKLGGRAEYRLQPLPVSDFPSMSAPAFSHRFTMPGASLRSMLESTARAMSKEENRYYLNGVYMHAYDGLTATYDWSDPEHPRPIRNARPELRVCATDGHRLYRADIELPDGADGMRGVILPRGMVELFLKLTGGKGNCPDTVDVDCSDTKVRLSFGGLELLSKLVDGTFPDYQRVVPTGNDKVATMKAADFMEALDSVTVISSERGRAVKLLVEDGRAVFSVNNPDSGSATMEIQATLAKYGEASPSIEIGFNADYLKTLLKDLSDDGGEIMVEFGDAGSPTIFKSGREGFFAILMPMRV